MECEQSYFTFCTLFPFTLGLFGFLKLDTLIDIVINGAGVGRFRKTKKKLTIETTEGQLRIPTVKLPNLDWEMYFIDENSDIEDGFHVVDDIEDLDKTKCKQYRDLLLCEYFYSSDYCSGDLKAVLSSPLDDWCYVFTVNEGDTIDYKTRIETFLTEIEN